MKNCFTYLLFFVVLGACQEVQKAPKPDQLIPEEKMVDILVDLAKIDAAMTYNMKYVEKNGIKPKSYIYKKYGIDSVQLTESNAYYMERFEVNKRMYDEARARLQKQRKKLDSLQAIKDSIQRMEKKSRSDEMFQAAISDSLE